MAKTSSHRSDRMPIHLQAVYFASNRGHLVHIPPPNQVASKVFLRKDRQQTNDSSSSMTSKNHQKIDDTATPRVSQLKEKPRMRCDDVTVCVTNCFLKLFLPAFLLKSLFHSSTIFVSLLSFTPKSKNYLQAYLDNMLRSRGYSTQCYKTLSTSYYNRPTPLQQASSDAYMHGLVHHNDVNTFQKVMSCGISPNPCSSSGESLVHKICKHGNHRMLKILLENGGSIQVSDYHGRTPLHNACWSGKNRNDENDYEPSFETVKLILKHDSDLLYMVDIKGHLPLDYVPEHHWSKWIEFFRTNVDVYWPVVKRNQHAPPPRALERINTCPIPDPTHALPLVLAKMVASGSMSPEDAQILDYRGDDNDDADTRLTENSDHDDISEASEHDDFDGNCKNSVVSEPHESCTLTTTHGPIQWKALVSSSLQNDVSATIILVVLLGAVVSLLCGNYR